MSFPVGWTRQCALTVDHTKVGSTLSNYPALIGYNAVGSETNLPTEMLITSGANAAKSDGSDIRFSSDSAGVTGLHSEIVNWTQHASVDASRKAEIYVSVPSVSSSVDTIIYVWYANSSASAPAANDATFGSQGVWDSNFGGVWHLKDGSVLSAADSTSNGNNGTIVNPTATTGKINGGASYATNDTVDVITAPGTAVNGATGSVEMWVKPAFTLGSNSSFFWDVDNQSVTLYQGGGANSLSMYNNGRQTNFANVWSANSWHHIVALYNVSGNVQRFFTDGVEISGTGASGTWGATTVGTNFYIGRRFANFSGQHNAFIGIIDEVRTSLIIRPDAWITTTYKNQNSPSTFWTVGTPATVGSSITYRRTFTGNMRGR